MTLLAGIDIGGTKCLGVVVDENGVVVGSVRKPTPIAAELADLLLEITVELGPHESLGVGVPGLITRDGVIRASPNLKGASEFPLQAQLESKFGKRVWVDNDATAACLAEWKLGAARGHSDVWMVTLGTGIGGGLVSGGVLQTDLRARLDMSLLIRMDRYAHAVGGAAGNALPLVLDWHFWLVESLVNH